MSIGPDLRASSVLVVPANTQHDLCDALLSLAEQSPDLVKYTGPETTQWERRFEVSATGAAFLASLLRAAQT